MATVAAFDRVADRYDAEFSDTWLGKVLRARVWRHLAAFSAGQQVLELGCGTGEDALWLAGRGVSVLATDVSEGMLSIARAKAAGNSLVRFQQQDANALSVEGPFAGAYANFGVLNCVGDLPDLGKTLAGALQPGARFVAVVMPPFCAWETAWYLLHGDLSRATRRWRLDLATVRGARLRVRYPSYRTLVRELSPWFSTRSVEGLGTLLPPTHTTKKVPHWFAALDARMPLGHLWADHYVAVLERR